MKIFNTLSGKTEEFNTMKDGVINMYVCGPTVYSYAHVGNMCPVIIFDMVYRYFKYRGYDVNQSFVLKGFSAQESEGRISG